MYLRPACAIVACLLLAGCAVLDPEANARAQRQTLRENAWGPPTVAPANPRVAGYVATARKPTPPSATPAVADTEPGSCATAESCGLLLRLMVDDPKRSWIAQRPSAAVYANGTRAFAYLGLRAKLTCTELTLALDDLQISDRYLNATIAGASREKVERVRALNARVRDELGAEQADRCGKGVANPT